MSCSSFNFDEIKVYDDELSDFGIIKEIIEARDQEDAFYILDVGDVIAKHQTWLKKMPRVQPYFAIKCNPDPTVIKVLAAFNSSFDCASKNEIKQVMAFGVPGDRIIFAHPAKPQSHIKFAREVGVDKMVVDSEAELLKIKDLFPSAKILIRFRCDARISEIQLGSKFGCDPGEDAPRLIQATKDFGLELYGFSFHVGSQCGELAAYSRGIDICMDLIELANSVGCKGVKMIDIGGGFPGESGLTIDKFAEEINKSLEAIDPSIEVISEPGRYYVASAFTSATLVYGTKTIMQNNKKHHMYYINDGVFGSFLDQILNVKDMKPVSLKGTTNDIVCPSSIWGPTLDTCDCVVRNALLPKFNVGDWLIWTDMGAYTRCLGTIFNGFFPPAVYPFIRKSQRKAACKVLKFAQHNWNYEGNVNSDIDV